MVTRDAALAAAPAAAPFKKPLRFKEPFFLAKIESPGELRTDVICASRILHKNFDECARKNKRRLAAGQAAADSKKWESRSQLGFPHRP